MHHFLIVPLDPAVSMIHFSGPQPGRKSAVEEYRKSVGAEPTDHVILKVTEVQALQVGHWYLTGSSPRTTPNWFATKLHEARQNHPAVQPQEDGQYEITISPMFYDAAQDASFLVSCYEPVATPSHWDVEVRKQVGDQVDVEWERELLTGEDDVERAVAEAQRLYPDAQVIYL